MLKIVSQHLQEVSYGLTECFALSVAAVGKRGTRGESSVLTVSAGFLYKVLARSRERSDGWLKSKA